ncbi:8-amino-7-oxononanoate synthase [Candidatus Nitronereus thalassa]|uniref:8-amino-7-ketopelargonate synthase n=1 Tax=Candidatus Nitronereus thalassa TaxID=3020898 RepID=A0ABU3K7U2_9BACT|nr:8-amino-7-oxononanoate synthase [Candidatus Nitronereus thalassa]MDT7042418.1 8-amino-7-oxononanoate synthase [Candidatus Nitronereus thalassa]
MLPNFEQALKELEFQHLRRQLRIVESSSETTITIEGRKLISMASNNYLGLANHSALKQAAIKAINEWGVGAGAARLISGTMRPHQQLEEDLAHFKQVEGALTFGTGYTTNLGLIPSLIDKGGLILADRYCHASLIEACRLAKATLRVFHHNGQDHLEKLLKKRTKNTQTLVVTEGVFSMDGDLAPLPDLLQLCQNHGATLVIDDAHGTGVMGPNGRGTIEHFGLNPADVVQMGTLSKAIGTSGGYVAGTTFLKEFLINASKAFIYTTAPPPAIAAAASTALQVIQQEPGRRQRLWDNRNYLYSELRVMGFQLTNTQSPILPIIVKSSETALKMAQALDKAGIYIPAIRPPTVPKNSSRLRLTISSEHRKEQLMFVVKTIQKIQKELKLA